MTIWKPSLQRGKARYLAIVDALADDIASGKVDTGSRLPTQRDLALRLGVSVGTVTRAYAVAEQRGLIRGETGRGTFVGTAPPEELPIGDLGDSVRGSVNLGMTWPLESENPDLAPTLRKLARRPDLAELLRYQPNTGTTRHREAGAEWIARHGFEVPAECVAITAGTQHALTVVLSTLARPGETILTEDLTYPGLRAVADFLGLKLAGVPVDDEGLLPDALDSLCRQRKPAALYCVPSIQNPTATVMPNDRRETIARIAKRHGLRIVEDAIHHRLLDDPPHPIASIAPEFTYFLAGPSKTVAGGLRVAWVAAPRGAIERLAQRTWATTWMVPPLTAEIFAEWIDDGTAEATLERKRSEAAARVALLRSALPDADVTCAPAGYHAWLRLPDAWDSGARFAEAAERRGVAVTPADAFWVGTGRPPAAVRISMSAPRTRATLAEGLERLAATLGDSPGIGRPIV